MQMYNKILMMPSTNVSTNTCSNSTSSPTINTFTNKQYDLALDIPTEPKKQQAQPNLQKTSIFLDNTYFFAELQRMNTQQRLIFDDIMLKKRLAPNTPIHLFMTADARTRKTFALLLIIQGLLQHYTTSLEIEIQCSLALVMAYTGNTTLNIGGTTIHSALHLPLASNTKTKITFGKLNTLFTHYKNLKFIIIDKILLVRTKTFQIIDSCLRSIMHVPHKPFEGLDIFCGNLFQASPICDA